MYSNVKTPSDVT